MTVNASAALQLVYAGSQSAANGNVEQAETAWRKAVELNPECAVAWKLLADSLASGGNVEAALQTASQILQSGPDNLDALYVRQQCWKRMACASEDVADCRRIISLRPNAKSHSALLFKLNRLSSTTPEILFAESRYWNELYAAPLSVRILPHTNTPDPERRLKIGYVSPDLYRHPIMKLLPPVFEHHNRAQFEIFVYSIGDKQDELTRYVCNKVEHFIELPPAQDKIAARVRADQIDILIDLAGHTMPADTLLAFALKPAPIQVNWMGVHATTGLTAMDYFLGDAHMPCPGTEHLFSEKVYRLKRIQYCYRPDGDPGIMPSPLLTNGYITFGCFNSPVKITREAVKVWSVILHLHPGSKMFLKYKDLEQPVVQKRFRQWFLADGISEDRLLFEGAAPTMEYLASWNKVDIALDPFPYNGGTTTLDALWMGVPVVTICGRLAVNCCGASFLAALGLPIAETFEEYIAIAGQYVEAIPKTPGIRTKIRDAMVKSPLMDEKGFVQNLEAAYRDMWRTWCSTHVPVRE